jgi:Tfp pilus assembly protein PilO
MLRSFNWKALAVRRKDPRAGWRVAMIGLAILNLAAFLWLIQPGGTAAELDDQLNVLRAQVQRQQAALGRLRAVAKKVETAQAQQEEFMKGYFMDRRTASSTILTEIGSAARQAGLKPKEHAFIIEPIEGSETLSMMTITANYEGSYADLIQFVNQVDRSKRFLIIENITASPQQIPGMLASRFKINTFVREERP